MRIRSTAKKASLAGLLATLSDTASASGIMKVPCDIVLAVADAFKVIGPSIVAIMFVYGGIKYAFSADDPGGRKQGKTICIHAVIGAIIMLLVGAVISLVGATGKMCGVTF
ncbi:MAG: hypothetical protein KKD39_01925 [Candidatus Altiarchaeota archaeon]|nr:hypothetical protein [Candidatus Altiarchaeota archaeon]